MNKALFLMLGLFFILSACKKQKDRVSLPFVAYVEVPAGLGTFLTYHFPARVATNGLIPNNMIDAQPARIRVTLESGESSFNFARRMYLDATTDSSFVEMGYNLDVMFNNSRTIDIYPSIVNLKDHISQDSFNIKLKIELRSQTTLTSRIRIDFSLQATLDQ